MSRKPCPNSTSVVHCLLFMTRAIQHLSNVKGNLVKCTFFSELNSGSCSGRQSVPELLKKSFSIDFFALDLMMNHTVNKQVIGTRVRIVMKNNTLFISKQIK